MALMDAMFEFSDAQQVLTQAAHASTNTLDWQAADREMGAGTPIWLNVRVSTAFTTSASGTLTIALCYDTVDPIDGSSTVVYQTPAIAAATLTLGFWVLRMPLPVNVDEERIMGLLYTVGTGAMDTGNLDAWLDHGPQSSFDTQVCPSNI